MCLTQCLTSCLTFDLRIGIDYQKCWLQVAQSSVTSCVNRPSFEFIRQHYIVVISPIFIFQKMWLFICLLNAQVFERCLSCCNRTDCFTIDYLFEMRQWGHDCHDSSSFVFEHLSDSNEINNGKEDIDNNRFRRRHSISAL